MMEKSKLQVPSCALIKCNLHSKSLYMETTLSVSVSVPVSVSLSPSLSLCVPGLCVASSYILNALTIIVQHVLLLKAEDEC